MSEIARLIDKIKSIENAITLESNAIQELSTALVGLTVLINNIDKNIKEIKNGNDDTK